MNLLPFKNAVERHVDLFATKEASNNLKEKTFTIMYSDLSDEDCFLLLLLQPRAMDAIVDEMIEAVGTKNCKVVTGKH